MKRNKAIRPNQTITVGSLELGTLREIDMVTREALIEALIDGATMLEWAGGVLEVVVGRAPTDVPGEMVLTGAILTWKDKTDATTSPEATRAVVPVPVSPPSNEAPKPEVPFVEEHDRVIYDTTSRGAEVRRDSPEATPENPDGFDYSKLAEEDIDEPVPTR